MLFDDIENYNYHFGYAMPLHFFSVLLPRQRALP